MNREEIIKQLTEIMVSLRSVEHSAAFAKASSYIDYALNELKQERTPTRPATSRDENTNACSCTSSADADESDNTSADADDYEISQAGGANPADDANFGLKPAL